MSYKSKEKQGEYSRRWHSEHRLRRRELNSDQRVRARAVVARIKAESCCVECGYNKCAAALEFHHEHGHKDVSLALVASKGWGEKRILEEVAKCRILCANCHREVHFNKRA